jgi:hypothetical protein
MIPMGENGQDFDFGTAAMKMLEGIRQSNGDQGSGSPGREDDEPPSPSPGMEKGLEEFMVLADEPEPSRSVEYRRSAEARRNRRKESGSVRLEDLPEVDGMEYIEETSREE